MTFHEADRGSLKIQLWQLYLAVSFDVAPFDLETFVTSKYWKRSQYLHFKFKTIYFAIVFVFSYHGDRKVQEDILGY